MHEAVQRAISIIRNRYYDQLTLEELAAEVFFSPFHFSRLFRKNTGLPPGQYLSAVRLFEAKRLLMTTSRTVADIVTTVGYSSVGTFTTRFTRATGMSPTHFRESQDNGLFAAVGPGFVRLPSAKLIKSLKANQPRAMQPTGSILSAVEIPHEVVPADVLIGVFESPIPQAEPVACRVLTDASSTEVVINEVPPGRWFIIAIATGRGGTAEGPVLIGTSKGMVSVAAGHAAASDVRLRSLRPIDPPIAVMLASPRSRRLVTQS